MYQACIERGDKDAADFWNYVLGVVKTLGAGGMSDEDDADEDINVQGVPTKRRIKRVLKPFWRHDAIAKIFVWLDAVRYMEPGIFAACGLAPLPRKRVPEECLRPPPPNLPETFFKPGFFDNMPDYQKASFRLSPNEFPLRAFDVARFIYQESLDRVPG